MTSYLDVILILRVFYYFFWQPYLKPNNVGLGNYFVIISARINNSANDVFLNFKCSRVLCDMLCFFLVDSLCFTPRTKCDVNHIK